MALPDSVKRIIGTPLILADSLYVPTGNNSLGSRTDDLDLSGVANGLAEQSDRLDFTANMDLEYILAAAIEWAVTPIPTVGETVDFYMAWGANASTVGWPAGIGGAVTGSLAYSGYSSNLADSLAQLEFLGSMVATVQVTSTVQIDTAISTFFPKNRYGVLVVVNSAATADFHTDAVEMAVRLQPLTTQVQE